MDNKPTKGQYIEVLLRSPKTVFTTKDIALLWGERNEAKARVRLSNYAKIGKLIRVRRGIYAKDKNYDRYELATRIYTPAYISFETVLTKAGIVFQFYGQIFAASYLSREFTIGDQIYILKKIKNTILTNRTGIEVKENYFIASPERAFLDIVYLNKDYHFDNLSNIDWDEVDKILPIYGGNRRIEVKVKKYRTAAQAGLN